MIRRRADHLLLTPRDIAPSCAHVRVAGVFNPGVVEVGDEIVVLARIAEAPAEARPGYIGLPRWRCDGGGIEIDWRAKREYRDIDPRVVETLPEGLTRLTFTSHLRLFRFDQNLKLLSPPTGDANLSPLGPMEVFGVEDPRITFIEDWYYVTYVAVSPHGAGTALCRTRDFREFQRLGSIYPPENKDVVLFPEKLDGRFVCMHRPNPRTHFTRPEMWLGFSPDAVHWGANQPLLIPNTAEWQAGRIGGGCPPIRQGEHWLVIYHGNDKVPGMPLHRVGSYFGAALLLDGRDPRRVIGHSTEPILMPERPYERAGFVPNVIFPTAVLDRGESWLIFCGAADENICAVELAKSEVAAAISA